MGNKIFYSSLLISLIVHIIFLGVVSRNKKDFLKKKNNKLEVVYESSKVKPEIEEDQYKDLNVIEESKFEHKVEIIDALNDGFSPIGENIADMSKFSTKIEMEKKLSAPISPEFIERQISVPIFKSEKITNPKYLSYNQQIRQKIRRQAYTYVDHPDFQMGEVYMTFVLASTGRIKRISVLEGDIKSNDFLQNIGRRSIKEAGPFAPFPKDLDYPELTFNVVISFEIK